MTLRLKRIVQKGDLSQERLVIDVVKATQLGEFLLLRTRLADGLPSTDVLNTLWFPDKEVAAGDVVVVYSKKGIASVKLLPKGKTAHFFYLNKDAALWKAANAAAVLLHAPDWETFEASEL